MTGEDQGHMDQTQLKLDAATKELDYASRIIGEREREIRNEKEKNEELRNKLHETSKQVFILQEAQKEMQGPKQTLTETGVGNSDHDVDGVSPTRNSEIMGADAKQTPKIASTGSIKQPKESMQSPAVSNEDTAGAEFKPTSTQIQTTATADFSSLLELARQQQESLRLSIESGPTNVGGEKTAKIESLERFDGNKGMVAVVG